MERTLFEIKSYSTRRVSSAVEVRAVGDFFVAPIPNVANLFSFTLWLPTRSEPTVFSVQCLGTPQKGVWAWDGNLDLPTISPAVHAPPFWYGSLRMGRLEHQLELKRKSRGGAGPSQPAI